MQITQRKRQKAIGPKSPVLLDHVAEEKMKKIQPKLSSFLKWYILVVVMCELVVFGGSIASIAIWWYTGYTWTMIVRLFGQLRLLFSAASICCDLPVYGMFGTGKFFKIPKTLALCLPLGLWVWIGLIDLILLRITMLIIDVIYFISHPVPDSPLVQILIFIVIGIVLIIEPIASMHFIYYSGIRIPIIKIHVLRRSEEKQVHETELKKNADQIAARPMLFKQQKKMNFNIV